MESVFKQYNEKEQIPLINKTLKVLFFIEIFLIIKSLEYLFKFIVSSRLLDKKKQASILGEGEVGKYYIINYF